MLPTLTSQEDMMVPQGQWWNISLQHLLKQDLEDNMNAPDGLPSQSQLCQEVFSWHWLPIPIFSQQQRICFLRCPSSTSIFAKFPECPADNKEDLWFLMPEHRELWEHAVPSHEIL